MSLSLFQVDLFEVGEELINKMRSLLTEALLLLLAVSVLTLPLFYSVKLQSSLIFCLQRLHGDG